MERCMLRWQGPHRATVRAGSRRLSSCLLFLLRFIFLARERGKRWWWVRRSSPTGLPHSSHLPAALSPWSSSLGTIPRLYGPSMRAIPASAFFAHPRRDFQEGRLEGATSRLLGLSIFTYRCG